MLETNKDLANAEELSEKVVKNLIKGEAVCKWVSYKRKSWFFSDPIKEVNLDTGLKKNMLSIFRFDPDTKSKTLFL